MTASITLTGQSIIGSSRASGGEAFHAVAAATGDRLEPAYRDASEADVDRACELARAAFDDFRRSSLEVRAAFLEAVAAELLALGPALIERAMAESGLPQGRLQGECNRTVGQLRLFAGVVRQGLWIGATLDAAQPERQPAARPDLRMGRIALGPVAVFGASNFPLAFSVAGGDTASALAAGCPVVVKAHPAHPGTSELVGMAIQRAVAAAGLPEGVFSLVFGAGESTGSALVRHPAIAAVGFTGSRRGGLALTALAQKRSVPIPVYAEMSAINPVLLMPAALSARAEAIARGFVDSLTLGAGQFCTNPGLLIAVEGEGLSRFESAAAAALAEVAPATMLTPGIHASYAKGIASHAAADGVHVLGRGRDEAILPHGARAALFATSAQQFIDRPALADEVFGPAAILVRCRDDQELRRVLEALEGQLTATLQMDDADLALAAGLMPVLERKAGRILANAFPTGVEVTHAMVHGGPYPATSDSRSTSVGSAAIDRFLRPVCYQGLPAGLLPPALQDGNPLRVWRLVDGQLSK